MQTRHILKEIKMTKDVEKMEVMEQQEVVKKKRKQWPGILALIVVLGIAYAIYTDVTLYKLSDGSYTFKNPKQRFVEAVQEARQQTQPAEPQVSQLELISGNYKNKMFDVTLHKDLTYSLVMHIAGSKIKIEQEGTWTLGRGTITLTYFGQSKIYSCNGNQLIMGPGQNLIKQ
jgi:flagellar basal body-associated protein FliL